MHEVRTEGRGGGLRPVRQLVALAMVVSVVATCGGEEGPTGVGSSGTPDGPSTPAERTPAESSTARPDGPVALPPLPETGDPATLARQVDHAMAASRDADAAPSDLRRAAEFHQLAVHVLATAPERFRRKVTTRLQPQAARVTRSDVRAARAIRSLNDPQPRLPRWRVLEPPPAEVLLGHYRQAQRRTGVPWPYLAAIHLVETRMGRIRGTSTAGAKGPMQFLPSTWDLYGAGGDINDPKDAILAAARLLKDNGAPGDMADALYAYNPADEYVRAVSEHARTMRRRPSAYHGYWHWQVLYRHTRGTYVLPLGYPESRPIRLPHG